MHPKLRRIALPPARLALKALTGVFSDVHAPDGHDYRVNRNIHPFDYIGLRRGLYERDEREMIGDIFAPDHTIIDIGANIGVVATAAFENKLLDNGRMFCLEPNPESLPALRVNMDRARARFPHRDVWVIERALAPGPSVMAEFRARASLCSGLSSTLRPNRKDRVIQVPTISLTDLMARCAPAGASLICDIEGGEIDMIRSEKPAFDNIRQIAIELHEPHLTGRDDATPDSMAGEIEQMGFRCRARAGNTFYFSRPVI